MPHKDQTNSLHASSVPEWMQRALDPAEPGRHTARSPEPNGVDGTRVPAPERRRTASWRAAAVAGLAGGVALIAIGYYLAALTTGGGGEAASDLGAREPVSAVADSLLPSVVQLETRDGLGSGVVYSAGFILTAAHVIEGEADVTIRLADGRRVPGRVVGTDAATDVGVVHAERGRLTPARLARGVPIDVGQLAIAIGSPFGLESTVTSGVVSAIGRSVPTERGASSMIQTDAPINPGNSGGALADRAGRVIGINDAIRSETGVNSGVGFAIPIDVATSVADALISGRAPQAGFLGVGGTGPSIGRPGALLTQIEPDSPAADAGLRPGDLVSGFANTPVTSMLDLMAKVRVTSPGTEVELEVFRDGTRRSVSVVIGRQ
jgi:putative serine protease PepD